MVSSARKSNVGRRRMGERLRRRRWWRGARYRETKDEELARPRACRRTTFRRTPSRHRDASTTPLGLAHRPARLSTAQFTATRMSRDLRRQTWPLCLLNTVPGTAACTHLPRPNPRLSRRARLQRRLDVPSPRPPYSLLLSWPQHPSSFTRLRPRPRKLLDRVNPCRRNRPLRLPLRLPLASRLPATTSSSASLFLPNTRRAWAPAASRMGSGEESDERNTFYVDVTGHATWDSPCGAWLGVEEEEEGDARGCGGVGGG